MPEARRPTAGAALLALTLSMAAVPVAAVAATPPAVAHSPSPDRLLISFREVFPEFADQDPTPLVRVYGDGRVVVHRAAYMRDSGVFQMWLSPPALEALLLEITPTLLAFDAREVAAQRRAAEAARRTVAAAVGEPELFYVADAELSVFDLDIDSYRPAGAAAAVAPPRFRRVWRGLRYDAERFADLEAIQGLMRAEQALRALGRRPELLWVAPAAP